MYGRRALQVSFALLLLVFRGLGMLKVVADVDIHWELEMFHRVNGLGCELCKAFWNWEA